MAYPAGYFKNLATVYINSSMEVISISILYHTTRLDEKENTDFIYYGVTEMMGLHTKKPLILHGKTVKGEEPQNLTSRNVFPEYYMIYVEKFEDMIHEDIDEWVYFFKRKKKAGKKALKLERQEAM
jgi:hypothetical protein